MLKPADDLSVLEQQVLLALIRHHPNGYGVSVSNEIETKTGKRTPLGSIYSALDRLKTAGLLKSREGEPSQERGGRRKLHFELTAEGHLALERALSQLDALRAGISNGGVVWAGR